MAVAAGNNGIGVTGVAPGCRLIAERWGVTVEDDADMFYWARDQGAAVITNSWAFTTRICPDLIKQAIEDVATGGRGGLGCVVLFAAGNENEEIRPLSCAALPHVIAVGASTSADTRASYSNFGRTLAVVAPSSGAGSGITTTDRTGSALGYGGHADPNYTSLFGGTSSATPLTAGVAALVLSVDPTLYAAKSTRKLCVRTTTKPSDDSLLRPKHLEV